MEVSYTALKSVMECPYSYYLRYVKRISLQEGSATIYGSAVHNAIKAGYDNKLPREEWGAEFKKQWVNLTSTKNVAFVDENEYLKKFRDGEELLYTYYDKYVKRKAQPKTIEMFFGRDAVVKMGEHTLIGVFDQIDAKDRVIDYKTGVKPTQAQLDMDLQFTIYSYAYRTLFQKEESGLILRHLGTMKDMETSRTEKDFEIIASELDKIDKLIRHGNFVRNIGRSCARCFFLQPCLGKERKLSRW